MSLKQAFAALRQPEVKVQLVPGDPNMALRRVANSLTGTDLLLIAADQDRDSLAAAWTWVPRMLTATSLVFHGGASGQAGTDDLAAADAGGNPASWPRRPDETLRRAA